MQTAVKIVPFILLGLAPALVSVTGCRHEEPAHAAGIVAKTPDAPHTPSEPPAVVAAQKEDKPVNANLIAADNRFGFRLFHELLKKDADRNVLVSPLSIALALQMTVNGASGETKKAMETALELHGQSLEEINQANAALLASLPKPASAGESNVPELNIANGLWMRRDIPLRPNFLQRNKEFYGAEMGDLAGAPDNINAWVSTKTKGKIKSIVNRSDLDNIVAILVNAVYFKGKWTTPFKSFATKDAPFTLPDGRKQTCKMMHRSGEFLYYRGDIFQAVSLPYNDGRFRMMIFLPDESSSLSAFLAKLTPQNWNQWLSEFTQKPGDLSLPRFTFEYEAVLNDTLQTLGMGIAFNPQQADFTGMTDFRPVWIAKVVHKTFVKVDEEGTEAAAATGVLMAGRAALREPEGFRMIVDRPFFCAIQDSKTGALLFLGTVTEPKL